METSDFSKESEILADSGAQASSSSSSLPREDAHEKPNIRYSINIETGNKQGKLGRY